MWSPEQFEANESTSLGVYISCGDEGMQTDLAFNASECDPDHPTTKMQMEIADYIVRAVKFAHSEGMK